MNQLHLIKTVQPKENYKLLITFDTGESFEYDANQLINKGVFQSLKNPQSFKKVFVNSESKTVTWENGLDLCPDALYQTFQAQK